MSGQTESICHEKLKWELYFACNSQEISMKTMQEGLKCLFQKTVLTLENDEHKYLYAALRKQSTRFVSIATDERNTSAVTSHNNWRAAGKWRCQVIRVRQQ
jgi:hypothetical protein